jgi:cystathionine beta-lyase/cystathionine gamma-synthase
VTPVNNEHHRSTRAVTAGRSASGQALAPTIWATSTWESTGVDDAERRATANRDAGFYSRYGNPTVNDFETAIAELEGAEAALAFASGMGAVASVVFGLCSAGDHVVVQQQAYAGTLALLLGPAARLGIETTVVDGMMPGALAAAVQPGRTMLVMAESPSNPRLGLIDLAELGALSGPFTVVDSTFATPMGQTPLEFGIDLVLHSATKGIAGHNDATIGVVAGEAELIDALWAYSVLHGAAASPYDAHNALRGLRTLAVRQAHQSASAQQIALRLDAHRGVDAVHYPGLATHPQHDLAARQMNSFGTMLSIEVPGGRPRIAAMFDHLELCRVATSLGGPETLLCHPATSSHVGLDVDDRLAAGATDDLVRISVGLEDPADIIADLLSALDASKG